MTTSRFTRVKGLRFDSDANTSNNWRREPRTASQTPKHDATMGSQTERRELSSRQARGSVLPLAPLRLARASVDLLETGAPNLGISSVYL